MKCVACGEKLELFYHNHSKPIRKDGHGGPGRGRNRDTSHPRRSLRRRGVRSASLLRYLGG